MLGIPSNPNDIDIKVFHLTEDQEAKLNELQFLSDMGKENYKGTCYSFVIGGVKINAPVSAKSDNEIFPQEIAVDLIDETQAKHHLINTQLVFPALTDKMKLKRDKDKTYMLNLIANLASL